MSKERLTAFSDGVLAIVLTIMVLDLKVPTGTELRDLLPVLPVFLSYALSFLGIAIYWNNHHHLMHAVAHMNVRILWANMNLLFWLSLSPFTTAWMGGTHFAQMPTTVYGASLLALIELGKAMGYELAAATTWNAVFVRTDQFPKLGLSDNGIDRMYYPVFETRVFWSINSYLNVSGCTRLIRHNYAFHPDQLQPVPPDLRNLPYKDGLDGAFLSTFF